MGKAAIDRMTNKLQKFLKKDKFSTSEWENRGLNPSSVELCQKMNELLNNCCQKLIELSKTGATNKAFKKELKNGLSTFNKADYDTEEKEFICDYFLELSQILDVNFKDELNKWLYGSLLNGMMKVASIFKGSANIIETLSQDCTNCNAKLETFITKKQEGIPDFSYDIVKCKACGEFNMINKGPDIQSFSFGEYELVEQLEKTEYTEEEAKARLEQIKYWRK
ncbi:MULTISPECIES: DUF4844 domain-containing protein [unclassified Imperialibacter]|uniref:DUF4844 domain-containing protein n=1 Tax=unclassified Imperialibacter TaxID=2629706 RepID=UPI0012596E71|nr:MULTISPECIES: DUF4844 domain-containing protein [unclassified Imperialibacter]CAD5249380.1 conserved hypothetical protein [Imperialibacter sp. 89]CAD5264448.1 conserved hypothetical protein [Imperialibacter sp. 75]VVT06868.1 conserved hypothetical protein [Imperialibacter sp. EC-SDR9]